METFYLYACAAGESTWYKACNQQEHDDRQAGKLSDPEGFHSEYYKSIELPKIGVES